MAFSLNNVVILGRLGKDPEKRSDNAPVNMSVATDRNWRDPKTNEWQTDTSWHNIIGWGKTGEAMLNFKKGDSVYIDGSLNYRTVEDQNTGAKRTFTDINAMSVRSVQKAGAGQGGQGASQGASQGGGSASSNPAPPPAAGNNYATTDDPF